MQNKPFRFGPITIPNAAGNVLNPPTATGGVNAGSSGNYIILQHLEIVNRTGAAATFSAYLGATGATAAGTEVIGIGKTVAANDSYHWYGKLRIDVADFLVMLANTANALTVRGEGEIGVAG
jgi:hypothetical protein